MRQLLIRFIRSFQKAIAEEMDAMRRRMGPFELLLASPRQVKAIESSDGRHFFMSFKSLPRVINWL